MEKIKTYTINWGDGNLIMNEESFIDYMTNGGLFSDDDVKKEPWEATVTVEFKYTEEDLSNLKEFDF